MNTRVVHKRAGFKTAGGVFAKMADEEAKQGRAAKTSSASNIDHREALTNGDPPKLMLWGSEE